MAYSTGSGTHTDLMNAVLTHAIADGWTTTGGGWPISKGAVRGVAWSTYTQTSNDWVSGNAVAFTETIMRIAIGTSPANATANVAANTNSAVVRNVNYPILDWYIFSDPGVGKPDFIHVVMRQSNGTLADVYNHFSFGEVDKGGLTYGSIAYVAASSRRGYVAISNATGNSLTDFNCGLNIYAAGYLSGWQRTGDALSTLKLISNPMNSIFPALGGWPLNDTVLDRNALIETLNTSWGSFSAGQNFDQIFRTGSMSSPMTAAAVYSQNAPYSGGVSMMPLPLPFRSSQNPPNIIFAGAFPEVRVCNLTSFNPGDEVTLAGEVWKLFPLLRRTPWADFGSRYIVSSGMSGYAFKKAA